MDFYLSQSLPAFDQFIQGLIGAYFQQNVHVFMILEDVFKFNNMLMVQCLVDLDLCDQLDYGFFTFCLALDRFKELLAIILAAETRLVSRLVIS